MDVILVSHASGRTRRLRIGPRNIVLWGAISFLFLALLSSGFAVGYWSHRSTNRALSSSLFKSLNAQVESQRKELATIRTSANANADALSRKLAQLQAQMIRLDAAGQRMVQIAGIKSDEFNFNAPVGEGGPDLPIGKQPVVLDKTLDSIDAFGKRLAQRQREYQVLEDILLTGHLQKEITPSGWPIRHGFISSVFGPRIDPFTGRRGFHPGIDFAGARGSRIHAVAAGVVSRAGPDGGYGNLVEVNDGNGLMTLYGHNEKILVHVGERVHRGQVLALEGSTGRSTGPHCHLEVRVNGIPVNPARYINIKR